MMIVKENEYGILPIRIDETNTEYPNKTGQIIVGTWTHKEIREAIKRGYKLIHAEWCYTC